MWSDFWKFPPMERRPDGELFRLTPKQARSVRRLAKKCCNYAEGECLPLDGACPQAISYSLICKHFRYAVLPTKPDLEQEILHPKGLLRCAVCGTSFLAHSGRAKYCPDCAKAVHRKQKAACVRRKRSGVDSSEAKS